MPSRRALVFNVERHAQVLRRVSPRSISCSAAVFFLFFFLLPSSDGRQTKSLGKSALPDVFVPESLFFGFLKRRARNSKEASPINQAAEQRQNKQHHFTRDDAITKDFFFFPNAASRLSFGALFPRAVQMSSRRHKQLNQRPPSGQFHRLIAVRHRAVCFPFFRYATSFIKISHHAKTRLSVRPFIISIIIIIVIIVFVLLSHRVAKKMESTVNFC